MEIQPTRTHKHAALLMTMCIYRSLQEPYLSPTSCLEHIHLIYKTSLEGVRSISPHLFRLSSDFILSPAGGSIAPSLRFSTGRSFKEMMMMWEVFSWPITTALAHHEVNDSLMCVQILREWRPLWMYRESVYIRWSWTLCSLYHQDWVWCCILSQNVFVLHGFSWVWSTAEQRTGVRMIWVLFWQPPSVRTPPSGIWNWSEVSSVHASGHLWLLMNKDRAI